MLQFLASFADRADEVDAWLNKNPVVLVICVIAIGFSIGGWGLFELKTGTAYGKGKKSKAGRPKCSR